MLTARSEMNRVFADQEAVTDRWWQIRSNSWGENWSRRAVEGRICVSHAVALSIAGHLCAVTTELRWKRFLLQVSRWEERPVRRGLN